MTVTRTARVSCVWEQRNIPFGTASAATAAAFLRLASRLCQFFVRSQMISSYLQCTEDEWVVCCSAKWFLDRYLHHSQNHHKYAQLFKNSGETTKALLQRAGEKYVTRAILQTQSVCVRGRMGKGTWRDERWIATSEQHALQKKKKPRSSLERKAFEREARSACWLQEAYWGDVLTKSPGKRSRKNHTPCLTESRSGQSKTSGSVSY